MSRANRGGRERGGVGVLLGSAERAKTREREPELPSAWGPGIRKKNERRGRRPGSLPIERGKERGNANALSRAGRTKKMGKANLLSAASGRFLGFLKRKRNPDRSARLDLLLNVIPKRGPACD
ncbi:hypothetical protein KFK09_012068 [Dendrobium nobile]|uniref:Uncharacterized protein n=1 Tax=Dendrobium nobile TaxID=94219 RepID=A0A8T3BJT9_DENNO|nr:hypothetical protein KFK09_012068 [Dendrobium nobile]